MDRPILKLPGAPFLALADWNDLQRAVAWIVFGTALPAEMWDAFIYPGARLWAHTNQFVLDLGEWFAGDRERTPLPASVVYMLSLAGPLGEPVADVGIITNDAVARRAAEQAYLRIRRLETRPSNSREGPTINALHRAIHRGATALCTRGGLGEVRVKAWPVAAKARADAGRSKPDLPSECLLCGSLTQFGLVLSWMAPFLPRPSDMHYTDLEFCGADLQRVWPMTGKTGRSGRPKQSVEGHDRKATLHAAVAWMQNKALAGPLPKREVALQDCMRDTGCTVRQARKALMMLPAELRRARGRPRRVTG